MLGKASNVDQGGFAGKPQLKMGNVKSSNTSRVSEPFSSRTLPQGHVGRGGPARDTMAAAAARRAGASRTARSPPKNTEATAAEREEADNGTGQSR